MKRLDSREAVKRVKYTYANKFLTSAAGTNKRRRAVLGECV